MNHKTARKKWSQKDVLTMLPDFDHDEADRPMRKRWDKESAVTMLPDFEGHDEADRPMRKRWNPNKPLTEIENLRPNNPADLPTVAQMRANNKSSQSDAQKLLRNQKKKIIRTLSKLENAPMPSSKALQYDRNRRLEMMRSELARVDEQLARTSKGMERDLPAHIR